MFPVVSGETAGPSAGAGPRHLEILSEIMRAAGASGRLTTDAHLAALAIETQSELHSIDADSSRFPGLRCVNPRVRVIVLSILSDPGGRRETSPSDLTLTDAA